MREEEEHILRSVYEATIEYLGSLGKASVPVLELHSPEALRKRLGGVELPEVGLGLQSIKQWLDDYLRHSVKTGKKMFGNQLFSGFSLPGYVGELATALTNTSMYTYEVAPVATLMEMSVIRAMNKAIGFSEGEGILTTGGTNANMTALFAALATTNPDWLQKGHHSSKERFVFFASEEAHYSFQKAASFLGLGQQALVRTPTNKDGQMRPDVLEQQVQEALRQGQKPFFVCATAGTTVLGAFDPIESIHKVTSKHRMWLHIDGAWGGSVALSSKHKKLLYGSAKADSFTWDPHKMMGLPLMCSTLLVRRKGTLKQINSIENADYLFHDEEHFSKNEDYDLGRMSMQCGRRTDALKLYVAWLCHGRQGFGDMIDRLFDLARKVESALLCDDEFELLRPVYSLNVCFRVLPKNRTDNDEALNKHNLRLRERLLRSGEAIVNYITIDGKVAFRLIVVNVALSFEDLLGLLNKLKELNSERNEQDHKVFSSPQRD